jgi:hypothetical protein
MRSKNVGNLVAEPSSALRIENSVGTKGFISGRRTTFAQSPVSAPPRPSKHACQRCTCTDTVSVCVVAPSVRERDVRGHLANGNHGSVYSDEDVGRAAYLFRREGPLVVLRQVPLLLQGGLAREALVLHRDHAVGRRQVLQVLPAVVDILYRERERE